MSKFQVIIIALLGLIFTVIAIPVGLVFWGAWKDYQFAHSAGGPTDHDRQMIAQGYVLNSADNRWYPWRDTFADHCSMRGVFWRAAFTGCDRPLTGGIPNQE